MLQEVRHTNLLLLNWIMDTEASEWGEPEDWGQPEEQCQPEEGGQRQSNSGKPVFFALNRL